ncbi:MAG: sorbosone dehydrogenase family protein, partial [Chthoniobacterales bacterium]
TQDIGGAVTGGCFYDSTAFPPAYRGNFFFGDYNSGRIMRVPLDAKNRPLRTEEFVTGHTGHVDMAGGPDGALYYAGQEAPGVIKRLVHTGTAQRLIVHPTALTSSKVVPPSSRCASVPRPPGTSPSQSRA